MVELLNQIDASKQQLHISGYNGDLKSLGLLRLQTECDVYTYNKKKKADDDEEDSGFHGPEDLREQRLDDRDDRRANDPTRAGQNVPSAYEASQQFGGERRDSKAREDAEYAALKARQEEIAAQRELEMAQTREDDWRDPIEADVDELVGKGAEIHLDDVL
jgi:hypothetical protein